jgi:hypothetical protein
VSFKIRKNDPSGLDILLVAVLTLLFLAGIAALAGLVLMFAWNLFAPSLFNAPQLTFPQSFGIMLFGIIVRSFIFGRSK